MPEIDIQENLIKKESIFSNLIFQIGVPFLIFFISSIVILYILSSYLYNQSYFFTNRNSMDMFLNLSHDINEEADSLVTNGSAIASFASMYNQEEAQKIASNLVNSRPQMLRIAFYNEVGILIWEVKSTPGKALLGKKALLTIPTSVYRENVFLAEKNVYLHNVQYPVINTDTNKSGILEITYDVSYLWEMISAFDVKSIYITDTQGKLLLSKVAVPKEMGTIDKSIFGKYSSKFNNVINYKDNEGETVSGIATEIKALDWVLILEDLIDKKVRTTRALVTVSIIFVILFCVIFLLEIYIINKKILSPLKRLKNNAEMFASGDFAIFQQTKDNNQFDSITEFINHASLSVSLLKKDFNNQVEIKTSQLLKSVREAESMSSLMVNREIKMIELKKENERLKAKLEKYKQSEDNIKGEGNEG